MYYYPVQNRYYVTSHNKNRFFPGGFVAPFALGFLTAPLILPSYRPRPNYYGPRPPYYGPIYY